MSTEIPVDEVNCKHAVCRSSNTVLVYKPIWGVGHKTAQAVVLKGAECKSCGLRFVTDQVRELENKYRPDPDSFSYDRNI